MLRGRDLNYCWHGYKGLCQRTFRYHMDLETQITRYQCQIRTHHGMIDMEMTLISSSSSSSSMLFCLLSWAAPTHLYSGFYRLPESLHIDNKKNVDIVDNYLTHCLTETRPEATISVLHFQHYPITTTPTSRVWVPGFQHNQIYTRPTSNVCVCVCVLHFQHYPKTTTPTSRVWVPGFQHNQIDTRPTSNVCMCSSFPTLSDNYYTGI